MASTSTSWDLDLVPSMPSRTPKISTSMTHLSATRLPSLLGDGLPFDGKQTTPVSGSCTAIWRYTPLGAWLWPSSCKMDMGLLKLCLLPRLGCPSADPSLIFIRH